MVRSVHVHAACAARELEDRGDVAGDHVELAISIIQPAGQRRGPQVILMDVSLTRPATAVNPSLACIPIFLHLTQPRDTECQRPVFVSRLSSVLLEPRADSVFLC
jgi:hypothetical protein